MNEPLYAGPWSWDGTYPIRILDYAGYVVCDGIMPARVRDARLIESAPMLLEALKLARDYIAAELAHRQGAYEGYPHKWATEMEDLASVDAAIAAATGENRHE